MTAAAQSPLAGHEAIDLGPLQILPDEQLVRVGGRTLTLSIRELHLLIELGRRADRIVSREELFRLAWGRKLRAGDRSVDVYVRRLRVKLEQALPEWRFIHTHFGFGYRLAPEQLVSSPASAHPEASGQAPQIELSQEPDRSFTSG
ncbi:MAG: winged helix-turn-helix domain-containing protein [Solirubrobacteraceae bacterium]